MYMASQLLVTGIRCLSWWFCTELNSLCLLYTLFSGQAFRDILSICQRTPARIQIVPDVFESLASKPNVPLVRDVTVHDLLGRAPTEIDIEACRGMLTGKDCDSYWWSRINRLRAMPAGNGI